MKRHMMAVLAIAIMMAIAVLAHASTHPISRGDTVSEIALQYKVTQEEIEHANAGQDPRVNGFRTPDLIIAGKELIIPDVQITETNAGIRTVGQPQVKEIPSLNGVNGSSHVTAPAITSITSLVKGKRAKTTIRSSRPKKTSASKKASKVPTIRKETFTRVTGYRYQNPGQAKFRGDISDFLMFNGCSPEAAEQIEKKVLSHNRDGQVYIEETGRVWRPVQDASGIWEWDVRAMGFTKKDGTHIVAKDMLIDWRNNYYEAEGLKFLPADLYMDDARQCTIALPWICDNPTILIPRIPPPPTVEAPPVAPPLEEAPPSVPPTQREITKALELDFEAFAYAGYQNPDGNHGDTTFEGITGGVFLKVAETDTAEHWAGIGGHLFGWDGDTGPSEVDYKGSRGAIGPAYQWRPKDRFRKFTFYAPLVGWREEYVYGNNYRSHQRYSLLGAAGRLEFTRGEAEDWTWFHRAELHFSAFWPLSSHKHHFFNGQRIPNGSSLRMHSDFNATGYQFIYNGEWVKPFVGFNMDGLPPNFLNIGPCVGAALGPGKGSRWLYLRECLLFEVLDNMPDSWQSFVGADFADVVRWYRGDRNIQLLTNSEVDAIENGIEHEGEEVKDER